MTKKEIDEYLKIKKKFEEKHFPLTKEESAFLDRIRNPNVAIRRLQRARILIELGSSFKTAKEDEAFLKKLRPILFDKSTTKKKVETMVMKERGLYLETPIIQNVVPVILEVIEGFVNEFPNYGELEELDVPEGTERQIQFKMKLPIAIYPNIFKNTCSTCGITFRSRYKLTSPIKQCMKCFKKGKKKS